MRWTLQEKERLVFDVLRQYADGAQVAWRAVSASVGSKTERQCYDEWLILNKAKCANLSRGEWTANEEMLMRVAAEALGRDAQRIESLVFPDLTAQQIEARLHNARGKPSSTPHEPNLAGAQDLITELKRILNFG